MCVPPFYVDSIFKTHDSHWFYYKKVVGAWCSMPINYFYYFLWILFL